MARLTMEQALGTQSSESNTLSVSGGPQPNKSDLVKPVNVDVKQSQLDQAVAAMAAERSQKEASVQPEQEEPSLETPVQPTSTEEPLSYKQQREADIKRYRELAESYAENVSSVAQSRLTDAEYEAMVNKGPIGFIEALRRTKIASYVPFIGTIADGASAAKVYDLAKRKNAGQVLGADEQKILDDYLNDELEFQIRGRSIGGTIGEMLPDSIAFMGEMGASVAATSTGVGAAVGLSSIAKAAGKIGAKKAVKAAVKKSLLSRVGKMAAFSAAEAAVMPQQIYKNYNNRKVYGSLDVTDKGELVFSDMLEKPATTFLKAYGDVFVEVLSEASGRILSEGINKATSPLFNKAKQMVPSKFVEAFNKFAREINPQNGITRFIKDKAMFNGVLAEMGEERVGDLLRVSFGLDDSQMDTTDKIANAIFPGTDQLLAEFGLFSIIGTSSMATAKAYDVLSKKVGPVRASEMVSVLPEVEKEKLADGEVRDVTPNINDKVSKDNPAREKFVRADINTSKSLASAYTTERARKILEKGKQAAEFEARKDKLSPLQYAKQFASTYLSWYSPSIQKHLIDEKAAAKISPKMATYLSMGTSIEQTGASFFAYGPSYRSPDNYSVEVQQNVVPVATVFENMQYEAKNSPNFEKDYLALQEIGDIEADLYRKRTRKGYRTYDTVKNLNKRKAELKEELGERAKEKGLDGTVKELGEAEYNRLLKHVYQISDYVKALNVGSAHEGVISESHAEMLNRNNEIMWPTRLERDLSDITAKDTGAEFLKKPTRSEMKFKEAKGRGIESTANRVDILEQLMDITKMHLTRRLNRRIELEMLRIAQSGELKGFVDLAKTKAEKKVEGRAGEKSDLTKDFGEQKNLYPVNVNGEEMMLVVSRDITDAIDSVAELPLFISKIKLLSNIFRAGVTTLRASFMVGNLYKDSQVAFIQSGDKTFIPFVDTARGMTSVSRRDDLFKSYARSGAMGSDIMTYGRSFSPASYLKGLAYSSQGTKYFTYKQLAWKAVSAPFRKLMQLNEVAELGTRVGVYGRNLNWNPKVLEDLFPLPSSYEVSKKNLEREIGAYNLWQMLIKQRATEYSVGKLKARKASLQERLNTLEGISEKTPEIKAGIESAKKELASVSEALSKLTKSAKELKDKFNKSYKEYGLDRVGRFEDLKSIIDGESTLDFADKTKEMFPDANLSSDFEGNAVSLYNYFEGKKQKAAEGLSKVNEIIPDKDHAYYQRMKEKLEQMPKETEFDKIQAIPLTIQTFKAAQDLGKSIEEAANEVKVDGLTAVFMARNSTTDFSVMGKTMRIINSIFPFTNAQVQGLMTTVRAFKTNPVATLLRSTAAIALPSVAATVWNLFGADDESRKEYLSFPDWERDTYMHFKLFGVWFKSPLPFEYGYLFGSVPSKVLVQMFREDKDTAKDFVKKTVLPFFSMISPVDPSVPVPQALSPILEYLANYNFWQQRNIVPEYQERLEPFKQYSHATSDTLVKLADIMDKELGTSFSPAKMQNFLNGMFGGFAGDVLDLSDRLIGAVTEDTTGVAPVPVKVSDLPVLDRFVAASPTGFRSAPVQDLLKEFREATRVELTYRNMLKTEDPRAESYLEAHAEEFDKLETLATANGYIKALGQQIIAVKESPDYTSEQKGKEIDSLEREMRDIAYDAMLLVKSKKKVEQ